MMDCVVLAGGVPQKEDLLYSHTQGGPKALIELAGKPMVQWVLDALDHAPSVHRIIVVGLGKESGVTAAKLTDYVLDQGAMLSNVIAGTEKALTLNPGAPQLLLCSADIPLIKPGMVENLIRLCPDPGVDLYHSVVSRSAMENRFPESRRSYAKFLDGEYAAGDMHIIAPAIAFKHSDLWDALMSNRKSVIKQAFNLGPGFLLKYVRGRLSLDALQHRVLEKFDLNVRVVPVDSPEMGMDADKPFQLDICRNELEQGSG
ncbi:MAG: nucleotidyltransferase family protein [Anaerolineae bacterium]|nr:nucleotidyltransferase family protein [Anaerolineae bacterium]